MLSYKTGEISKQVLKIIGFTVLVGASSVLAPQLPYVILKKTIKRKFGQTYNKKQLIGATNYLKRKKFIAYENRGNKIRFVLTKLGQNKLSQITINEITIKRTPWDQQWRLVSFDIPEESKKLRELFRKKLKRLSFFHFQRSVFITPFACEKEIDLITKNLNIEHCVHLLTAKRFRSDKTLVKKFNL